MRLPITLLALLHTAYSLADFKTRCNALSAGINLNDYPGATVTIADYVTQNTTIDQYAEGTNSTCPFPNPIVPTNLCRIGLHVPTSNSSDIYMEAWLPEKWNSRLMSAGTGGLTGCIFYPELAYLSERGFLAVSSNSGHNGTSAGAFLHQPEVFRDFTWRALYAATEIGKEVSKEIYSTPPKRSYFVGCSQGGRQGFKAAQFNPELFDGIIAGAPGLRLPGLFQHITRWVRTLGTDVNNLTISIDKWSAIQNETLRQCDHLDGIADGFIEDSRRCNPELSTLLCGNTTTPATCLSPEELAVVSQLFVPWHINNTLIYHGMAHNGGEVQHAKQLTGVDFLNFAIEWPRFVSLQDPSWTLDDWTPTDALLAINQDLFGFNTWEGDLSKFRNRGGKILHYHGVLDQAIDSTVSDAYYQHVSETLGATPAEIDEFYRYFHISGLEHCTGGPGAGSLGQISSSPPASEDEEDSVLSRIVAWVEKGEAPDTVGGAKFVNNDVAQGVEFKRKHCRYPFRNVYYGSGDGTDEEGWRCVE